jgi:hypothetical protein
VKALGSPPPRTTPVAIAPTLVWLSNSLRTRSTEYWLVGSTLMTWSVPSLKRSLPKVAPVVAVMAPTLHERAAWPVMRRAPKMRVSGSSWVSWPCSSLPSASLRVVRSARAGRGLLPTRRE